MEPPSGYPTMRSRLLVLLFCSAPAFSQGIDFATQVKPILDGRCVKCHGEKLPKADLRLDVYTEHLLGGTDPILTAGSPDKSLLYTRVTLPPDDPDVMPASGDPLTPAEIAVIKAWIEQGASWPKAPAADPSKRDPEAEWRALFDLPAADPDAAAAEERALAALRAAGGLATRVSQNSRAVDVNLSLLGQKVTDDTLALLAGLEDSLVWLNLSRTQVTDAGVAAHLPRFPRLLRINLASTRLTDAGLSALTSLPRLTSLNLYGTSITDAAVDSLSAMKGLRKVYVWQTSVTEPAAAGLREARPDLVVDTGHHVFPAPLPPAPTAVNDKCPVTGAAVQAAHTLEHGGKIIAFCCEKCLASFKADPAKFEGKLVNIAK
jgi:YHS domain-containing protein